MIPSLFEYPKCKSLSGKPASYYLRQMSPKKPSKSKECDSFASKYMENLPELPTLEEILQNHFVNSYGQIYVKANGVLWFVSTRSQDFYGEDRYSNGCTTNSNGGIIPKLVKTFEEAAMGYLQRANASRKLVRHETVTKAKDPIGQSFASLEEAEKAVKAGVPFDKANPHTHKKWSTIACAKVGNSYIVTGSCFGMPCNFEKVMVWDATVSKFADYPSFTKSNIPKEYYGKATLEIPKGSDYVGLVNGIPVAWKSLKSEIPMTPCTPVILWQGNKTEAEYNDRGNYLVFSVEKLKMVFGKFDKLVLSIPEHRAHGAVLSNGEIYWLIMDQNLGELVLPNPADQ